MLNTDEKNWATYCHIAALAGVIFPLGNIIAPLIVWILKKEEYQMVDDQGKEVLNFQITAMLGVAISAIFMFAFIGFVFMLVIGVMVLIYTIKGIIRTSEGYLFSYPFTIKFIK
ncbi:DUF4870 domain-containing protein [Labilibacter sediminis]|nr:DUF4870 domain-containing protein [Labilibacter sediminis]